MLKPGEIYKELSQASDAWVQARCVADQYSEHRKTLLAQLMVESEAKSMAAKETEALANPQYKIHVKEMVEAERDANSAKCKYDNIKILAELRRTEAANERAINRGAT